MRPVQLGIRIIQEWSRRSQGFECIGTTFRLRFTPGRLRLTCLLMPS